MAKMDLSKLNRAIKLNVRANSLLPKLKARQQKAFGRRFLSRMGWDANSSGRRGGGFGGSGFGGGGRSSFAGFDVTAGSASVPLNFSPDVADRVTKKSNANISTIINQLNSLVKAADRIGAITKDQQQAILDQIAAAKRVSKTPPAPPPIPEPVSTGPANNLTEVDKTINKLVGIINSLTSTIKEKQDEAKGTGDDDLTFTERFLENMGFDSDVLRKEKAVREKNRLRKAGIKAEYKDGTTRYRGPDGRYVSSETVQQTRAGRVPRPVSAPGLSSTTGQISRNVAQSAAAGGAAGAAGSTGIKAAIKAAAGPIVRSSVGKIATRSIPFVGTALGIGAGIGRLLEGDWKGAGLDIASGFGSLATALPLVVASVARDVYNSVFGVQPEEDPQFGERIGVVNDTVKQLVQASLEEKVDPKSTPTEKEVKEKLIPEKVPKTEEDAKRESAQAIASTAPPGAAPPSPAPGGGGGQSFPAAKGSSEYFTGKPGGSTASPSPESKPTMDSASMEANAGTSAGSMVSNPQKTGQGADIINASVSSPPPPPPGALGFNQGAGRFLPQQTQTDIAGRAGVGNVPNPDYIPSGKNNMGDLFKLMFFNVNYQEQ